MRLTPIVSALLIAPSVVLAQVETNPPSPEQQPGQTGRPEAPVPTPEGPPAPDPPPSTAGDPTVAPPVDAGVPAAVVPDPAAEVSGWTAIGTWGWIAIVLVLVMLAVLFWRRRRR